MVSGMAGLADELRQRSKDTAASANTLFESDDFEISVKKQSLFVIGQVKASLFSTLAEVLEELDYNARAREQTSQWDKRAEVLKRNEAIRRAAASGDWDEYDRIVKGGELATGGNASGGSSTGSDGAEGGS